jgi:hypothetical protein
LAVVEASIGAGLEQEVVKVRGVRLGGVAFVSWLMLFLGAQAARAALPTCSVTWTGAGPNALWSTAANWSTDRVPTATSDVCIDTFSFVQATPPISVHSLQLGGGNSPSLNFTGGRTGAPIKIATVLSNQGDVIFGGAYAVAAGSIDNPGTITSLQNTSITSSNFSNAGTVDVEGGTLTLPDAPVQLHSGILSAGEWFVGGGTLVLPHDISDLASARVVIVDAGSGIDDAGGHSALSGLSAIGSSGSLAVAGGASLSTASNLVSQGQVQLGDYSGGGGQLKIGGTYTEKSGAFTSLLNSTLGARSVLIGGGAGLSGGGTIAAPLTNEGTIEPFGTLVVGGDYTQGSAATFTSYFSSGRLAVTGVARLAGALDIIFNERCPPRAGSHYIALNYRSHTGLFSSVTSGFRLNVSSNSIEVTKL